MSTSHPRSTIGSLLRTTVVVGALVVAAVAVGWKLFRDPFETKTIDRSPPPVLTSIQSIAEFRAARGNFEVLVDLEKDVKYLPKVIAGKRVVFAGVGTVDAYVDFSTLDASAVRIVDDGTAVVVAVPEPRLADPALDPAQSRVVASDKGLFDRIGDLFSGDSASEQELYVAASAKMADAARATNLLEQAEENTTKLLEGLLGGLGFEKVTVVYVTPPPARANE